MIINYLCNTDSILCCTTRYISHIEILYHVVASVIIISIIISQLPLKECIQHYCKCSSNFKPRKTAVSKKKVYDSMHYYLSPLAAKHIKCFKYLHKV